MKSLVDGSMSTSEEMPYQDQPSSSARPIHISSDRFDHGGRVHSVSRKIRRVMRKSPPEEFQPWRDCLFHLANANLWPANGCRYHPRFLGKAPYVFAQGIDALPHIIARKLANRSAYWGRRAREQSDCDHRPSRCVGTGQSPVRSLAL